MEIDISWNILALVMIYLSLFTFQIGPWFNIFEKRSEWKVQQDQCKVGSVGEVVMVKTSTATTGIRGSFAWSIRRQCHVQNDFRAE